MYKHYNNNNNNTKQKDVNKGKDNEISSTTASNIAGADNNEVG